MMKEKYNDAQLAVLVRIEVLRAEKQQQKDTIMLLEADIRGIDQRILELRQSISSLATPPKPKRHRKTDEERLAELEKEYQELRSKILHD